MYYRDIMLEVTRKCNLKCEHCLRGKAQNKSIDDRVFERLPENISSLTITGGEPTLYPDLFKKLKRYGVYPENIWIKTNGKVFKRDYALAFVNYISSLKYKEEGITRLEISKDQFHFTNDAYKKYEYLFEYLGLEKYIEVDDRKINSVIAEGNAEYWGDRESKYKIETELEDLKDEYIQDEVYIACNGNVILGCNWSFKNIDKNAIGNILNESLDDIVKREIKRRSKNEEV